MTFNSFAAKLLCNWRDVFSAKDPGEPTPTFISFFGNSFTPRSLFCCRVIKWADYFYVLTVLERTGQPLTGRTIAALTGTVSQSTTSRLLIQLGQRGLVIAQREELTQRLQPWLERAHVLWRQPQHRQVRCLRCRGNYKKGGL